MRLSATQKLAGLVTHNLRVSYVAREQMNNLSSRRDFVHM